MKYNTQNDVRSAVWLNDGFDVSIGRRKVLLTEERSWIFNRMVSDYEARPDYPLALVDAIAQLAPREDALVLDVGAGLGHLAVPLAERGFSVTAVEPAIAMLDRLDERAAERGVSLTAVHAHAEALPFPDHSFDLVVVSDVVHFLDSERASKETARVLREDGALALVTCDFALTPFMQEVVRIMEDAAPRRPREISSALTEFLAVARIQSPTEEVFDDDTPVDGERLHRILRSISFIGPAMNEERARAFRSRIDAITRDRVWSRRHTLRGGKRSMHPRR